MNEHTRNVEAAERKVIKLRLDANFFFERAVRSLDRYRYDKALKYFQKAVEYEPENPVNHCNMAGILSEMGNYAASNQVLEQILDEVDPMMVECHFYMANNYANMEQFAEAEQQLLIYMAEDRGGPFAHEAEELMELIHHELMRSGQQPQPATEQLETDVDDLHEEARRLLENGQLEQACDVLEQVLIQQPEHDAARNNLAVTLQHLGRLTQAAEQIQQILERDPHNLHALCNRAILMQELGQLEALQLQIITLRQLRPMHQEHLLKLAITMAMLSEHDMAYRHFRRLLNQQPMRQHQELYHYMAAAACYVGKYEQAEQIWRNMLRFAPEAEVPAFYVNHLDELKQGQLEPSYRYVLPNAPTSKSLHAVQEQNPMSGVPQSVRLLQTLQQGTEDEQLTALQNYRMDDDVEVQYALREYVSREQIADSLRAAAERLLRQWSAAQHLPVDGLIDDLDSVRASMPMWDERWQQVVEEFRRLSPRRHDSRIEHDVEALWLEFVKRSYPELPRLHHPEGWAAALDYLVARIRRQPLTYAEVARRYGSTISLTSRYARRISRLCQVQQKIRPLHADSTRPI